MFFAFRGRSLPLAILFLCTTCGGSAAAYYYNLHFLPAKSAVVAQYKTPEESDTYVRFEMEAFDSIMQDYWQKPTESDLAKLYQLSVQKAANISSSTLPTSDRAGTAHMLATVFATATSTENKKQLAVNTLAVLLYNLPPNGRDQLLSNQQETALRQEVSNVNPAKDLYSDIGAQSGASVAAVNAAYQKTVTTLQASSSPEAKQKIVQATYAHEVLSNDNSKSRYDTSKVEPTVFSRTIGTTLYIYISKMSPTTLEEFQEAIGSASSTPRLESMVLDLRGNIGGSLQDADKIIGLFTGQNQYAFDLYHQGAFDVVRTETSVDPTLKRFGDIAVLTDSMTQSTAEVITAAFERFHLAHVVGATTRGWGSVENTFPITTSIDASTTYALLLVHSITLRPDNQPIEGRGVTPDVDISDPSWKAQLSTFFRSTSLINVLKQYATQPPLQ